MLAKNFSVEAFGECGFSGVGADHCIRITFYPRDFRKAGIRKNLICGRYFADDTSTGMRWLYLVPRPDILRSRAPGKGGFAKFHLEDSGQLRMTMRHACTSKNFSMETVRWQKLTNGQIRIEVPVVCIPDKTLFMQYPLMPSVHAPAKLTDEQIEALQEATHFVINTVDGSVQPFTDLETACRFFEMQKADGINQPMRVCPVLVTS